MASLADATPPIALGALDGRYRGAVAPLVEHLSEAALNRQRVHVEVEWLIHQTSNGVVPGVRTLTDDEISALRKVVDDFGTDEVAELGEIERVTVHDVKAVEYFLKKRLAEIAPAEADASQAVLETLEAALPAIRADLPARTRLTERLQEFLARLDEPDSTAAEVVQKIESASDDEIFDFIDNELGIES